MWHADPDRSSAHASRSLRPLIIAGVVVGAVLQHVIVSTPPEPVPSPPQAPIVQAPTVNEPGLLAPGARGSTAPGSHRPLHARQHQSLNPSSIVKGAHLLAPRTDAGGISPRVVGGALAGSITRAFTSYALPYVQDSALIVAVGGQFGIDPAIPAALFMHEDGNINNRALFPQHMNWLLYDTRNPGNIKCMYAPCYGGYQVYPTYRDGILDWFRLYDHYYFDLGIHDLAGFVAMYCPPNVDGNGPTAAYLSDVLAMVSRIHAT